jgi:hypothetical protein
MNNGSPHCCGNPLKDLAEWTGLEPATPGVTGRYSNQLNYHSPWWLRSPDHSGKPSQAWRPLGDSNPCYNRERVVS